MRQKIFPALLLFLLCFASGCTQENLDLDLDSCTEYIMNTVIFEDTLEELDRDVIRWRYNVEEDVDARVFAGSGATAEEVCVMQAIDDDSASDLVSLLEQHVQDQRSADESGAYLYAVFYDHLRQIVRCFLQILCQPEPDGQYVLCLGAVFRESPAECTDYILVQLLVLIHVPVQHFSRLYK